MDTPHSHHRHRNRHRWEIHLGDKLLHAARAVLVICMALLPFFWGGRHPLGVGFAGVCMLACGLLWLTGTLFRGSVRFFPVRGLWLIAAVIILGFLQLSPAFSALVMPEQLSALWDQATVAGSVQGSPSLAAMPGFQQSVLMLLCAAALFYALAAQLFSGSRGQLLAFAACIGLCAAICGFCGLVQRFGGFDWLFWVYQGPSKVAAGPYYNRNHFAQLCEMGLFINIGSFTALWTARKASSLRSMLSGRWRAAGMTVFGLAALVCAACIMFSESRTGILVSAAGLGLFLLAGLFSRRHRALPMPLIVLLTCLLLAAVYGLHHLTARLELALSGEDPSGLSRLELWKVALQVILLSPVWGTGFGGMRALAPHFDLSFIPGVISFDAHNDYLDLAIMLGIPCAALILCWLLLRLCLCIRAVSSRRARSSSFQPMALGVLFAMLAAAAHEVTDYGLKQPANLLVFLACAVLMTGLCRVLREASADEPDLPTRWKLGRPLYALPVLMLAACAFAFPPCLRQMEAGRELARLDYLRVVPSIRKNYAPVHYWQAMERQAQRTLSYAPDRIEALEAAATAHLGRASMLEAKFMSEGVGRLLDRPVSTEQVWRRPYRPYLEKAFASLSSEERQSVAAQYRKAEHWLSAMAAATPLSGLPLSAMAGARDQASAWSGERRASLDLHESALALYPFHTDIFSRALYGYWRAWKEDPTPEGKSAAEARLIELARSFGMQMPGRLGSVYPLLWSARPDPALLEALTPGRIAGQEQLAAFFMDHALWDRADAALCRMRDINAARLDEETPETLGNTGFLRREKRAKDVVERLVLERRIKVLAAAGREADAAMLSAELSRLRHDALSPQIVRADDLMARGEYALAEVLLRSMDQDPRALVRYAEILLSEGRLEQFGRVMRSLEGSRDTLDEDTRERFADLADLAAERGIGWQTPPAPEE